jgi:hypothetical protein
MVLRFAETVCHHKTSALLIFSYRRRVLLLHHQRSGKVKRRKRPTYAKVTVGEERERLHHNLDFTFFFIWQAIVRGPLFLQRTFFFYP